MTVRKKAVGKRVGKPAKKKSSKRYKSAGRPMTNMPRAKLVGGGIKGWRTAEIPVTRAVVTSEIKRKKKK